MSNIFPTWAPAWIKPYVVPGDTPIDYFISLPACAPIKVEILGTAAGIVVPIFTGSMDRPYHWGDEGLWISVDERTLSDTWNWIITIAHLRYHEREIIMEKTHPRALRPHVLAQTSEVKA